MCVVVVVVAGGDVGNERGTVSPGQILQPLKFAIARNRQNNENLILQVLQLLKNL
jgi:hypothetical protein